MILEISKHIEMNYDAPNIPDFIFHRDRTILAQLITLDEQHMKELLIYLQHFSSFKINDVKVSSIEFEDIKLKY